MPVYQPPCASTTVRQGADSFALFCSRQARICGALPTNCEQNVAASARQAIFSCMVGPDAAEACAMPAIRTASARAADFRLLDLVLKDLVMGAPLGWGVFESTRTLVEIRRKIDPMFMAFL